MYKITKNGYNLAMTEAPTYIKKAANGCYVLCPEPEAQGIAYNGQVFHLLGREEMEDVETVMLEETDAGEEISRAAEAGSIMFVTLAEAGNIDGAAAAEHAELFAPWAYPVKYKTGQIRRHTDGKLYRCLQDHTSQEDWAPDAASSLWAVAADPAEAWPAWSQPVGAHDAYAKDSRTSHNGKHWASDLDGNVWEPGIYGWTEVPEEA
ncbi:MAG: chitinase [Oscillibacter sp.]|nr:chitinase [Oscillibacter sp.]